MNVIERFEKWFAEFLEFDVSRLVATRYTDKKGLTGYVSLGEWYSAEADGMASIALQAYQEACAQSGIPDGWTIKPTKCDGVYGYMIGSPRENGVAANTAVWEDSGNPVERLLYLMLAKQPQQGNGDEPTQ